jgi:hypothetical protein
LEIAIKPAENTAPAAEPESTPTTATTATTATPTATTATTAATALSLAPYGAEALSAAERPQPVVVEIDTSHLSLAPQVFAPRVPIDTANIAAMAALDGADQFTLAPAEGDLLRPEEKAAPPMLVPAAPDLTLAEPGALLETLHEEIVWVIPDISDLSLAAPGGNLLSAAEVVAPPTPVVPDTSHLHLVD